ncbi:hypothetical protein C4J81_12880 [Deltaproteobacteria bacterium Smac51]|nr:hypothetical protein C4J81_12880 [Deltaproteobacteria bacterium Smac51]
MSRWAKSGSLDSNYIKVHPDACGAKKMDLNASALPKGGRTSKIHLVAESSEFAVALSLSPGNSGDAPEGRKVLKAISGIP